MHSKRNIFNCWQVTSKNEQMKLMQKQAQITIFFDSFVSLVNQVEPKGLLADIYEIYYDFLLFFSNLSIFHEFTKVLLLQIIVNRNFIYTFGTSKHLWKSLKYKIGKTHFFIVFASFVILPHFRQIHPLCATPTLVGRIPSRYIESG